MKAGREHRVPLSEPTLAILAGLKREDVRVSPISNMAMLMLLRRMGRGDLTVHGFRSTDFGFGDGFSLLGQRIATIGKSGSHRLRFSAGAFERDRIQASETDFA